MNNSYSSSVVWIIILLLSSLTTGCNYLQKRAQDFQDCIYLHAGTGVGLEAHVSMLTPVIEAGFGYHESNRIGIDGWQSGKWKEQQTVAALPLLFSVSDVLRPEYSEGMWQVPSFYGHIPFAVGNRTVIGPEIGIFLGGAGVEIGFDIVQFVDFFFGLFTIDLLSDDEIDLEEILSQEWIAVPMYRQRIFFQALRKMSNKQLLSFIPKTHLHARYLAFQELARRPVKNKLEIMIKYFDFKSTFTNTFALANKLLLKEARALPPKHPRRKMVEKFIHRNSPSARTVSKK